jgi:hypothetical protein
MYAGTREKRAFLAPNLGVGARMGIGGGFAVFDAVFSDCVLEPGVVSRFALLTRRLRRW